MDWKERHLLLREIFKSNHQRDDSDWSIALAADLAAGFVIGFDARIETENQPSDLRKNWQIAQERDLFRKELTGFLFSKVSRYFGEPHISDTARSIGDELVKGIMRLADKWPIFEEVKYPVEIVVKELRYFQLSDLVAQSLSRMIVEHYAD